MVSPLCKGMRQYPMQPPPPPPPPPPRGAGAGAGEPPADRAPARGAAGPLGLPGRAGPLAGAARARGGAVVLGVLRPRSNSVWPSSPTRPFIEWD